MTKIRVLCVTDYYLPGNKAGGPIRTIANMGEILAGEVDFDIVTRDRDLGDDAPFEGIEVNEWNGVGSSRVFYATPDIFGGPAVERAFDGHDVVYLNSFFSYLGSIGPYLKFQGRAKIVIAPRGEFSKGALALKSLKKRAFLRLARAAGLYRDIYWHASSALEAEDIERVFPSASERTHVAIDPVALHEDIIEAGPTKTSSEMRIAFISRISPKKNLDGLLSILAEMEESITLNIFGPIEDKAYWARCQAQIAKFPGNVRAAYCGILNADDVSARFAEHDLFAFPTHGENFGHVIFESLRAGTPVLLSDQTPWKADDSGAIMVAPLDSPYTWRSELVKLARRTNQEKREIRALTLKYAREYAKNGEARIDNLKMFLNIARGAQ